MATITKGNSSPVRTTRKSEIPSIPANHSIPRLLIHDWLDKNWNSLFVLKAVSNQTDIAPVTPVKMVASILCNPTRAFGVRATAIAPKTGRSTRDGITGNVGWDDDAAKRLRKVIRIPS